MSLYSIARSTSKAFTPYISKLVGSAQIDNTYNSDVDIVDLQNPDLNHESNDDVEAPSQVQNKSKGISEERPLRSDQNHPHPMLEFPLLYHCLRSCCSCLLKPILGLYSLRWSLSYPLQQRLPFTRTLRKIKMIYTWAELLMIIPFFACVVAATIYSFVYPDIGISGHACRTPLIFAFATAMHNSVLTLLLGLPFERALRYHKIAARMAYVNSILHTYVAFRFPEDEASPKNFFSFLFFDQINSGGTMLVVFMTCIVLTALPMVRRKCFEVFYYLHLACCLCMAFCAFFHTGYMVPMLVAICWGGDLIVRKIVMAWFWYPQSARLRIISNSVVEVSFLKTKQFAFNPGQYISICVPELTVWQWHPFSLSSSPEQDRVTLHIRKAGWWTTKLYELAENKDFIEICMEGPYGSVGVDLLSEKYSTVMLFSGGIGVTPMQSICNQLMYEHNTKKRTLRKVSFVWIERDPQVFEEVDVVRCASSRHLNSSVIMQTHNCDGDGDDDDDDSASIISAMSSMAYSGGDIATTLLASIPVSRTTDAQLEAEYPAQEFEDLDVIGETEERAPTGPVEVYLEQGKPVVDSTHHGDDMEDVPMETKDCRVLKSAYPEDPDIEAGPLDLQVYLTSKGSPPPDMPPFIHFGRPDVKGIFQKLRDDALESGERRIAVCVCAPMRLVNICRKACAKYSDHQVAFDFHYEVFD